MDVPTQDARKAEETRSLVCESCWSGPFSFSSFQTAWTYGSTDSEPIEDDLDDLDDDDDAWFDDKTYSYKTTLDAARTGAAAGCGFCGIICSENWENLDHESTLEVDVCFVTEDKKTRERWKDTFKGGFDERWDEVPCWFEVRGDGFYKRYHIYTTEEDPASPYILGRDLLLDVSSPSSYLLALNCLEDCLRNHRDVGCLEPRETNLPTRVIDCADPQRPKLFETNGGKGQYIALSYVWGESQPQSTRTSNIKRYLSAINVQLQPKTIRDAITAACGFGIRYLWVDALCIIQDSRDDKNREIPQMSKIFGGACLTLTAASAEKVSDGFLHDRQPPEPAHTRLPFICPDGGGGRIGIFHLAPYETLGDEVEEPIDARAWCLEERILSPRAMVYTKDTLQYSCRAHTRNVNSSRTNDKMMKQPWLPSSGLLSGSPTDVGRDGSFGWYRIVGQYTSRELTKPSDKLLAIAGLAEKYTSAFGEEYLGGLWQRHLHDDLLWIVSGYEASYPTAYRAPSWSWAALDGQVGWHVYRSLSPDKQRRHEENWDVPDMSKCEITGCETTLADPSHPFGCVTGGILKIRGHLTRVAWNPGAKKDCCVYPLSAIEAATTLIREEERDRRVLGRVSNEAVRAHIQLFHCTARPDITQKVPKWELREVWAIVVVWSVQVQQIGGLLLEECGQKGTGYYRRVGCFAQTRIARTKDITWCLEAPLVDISII